MKSALPLILAQRLWQGGAGLITVVIITLTLTHEQQGWYYTFIGVAALYSILSWVYQRPCFRKMRTCLSDFIGSKVGEWVVSLFLSLTLLFRVLFVFTALSLLSLLYFPMQLVRTYLIIALV